MRPIKRLAFQWISRLVAALIATSLLAACGPNANLGGGGIQLVQSHKSRLPVSAQAQTDRDSLAAGNTAFALNLYQTLRGKPGNLFFSPYSISQALAMTEAGARGATQQQMTAALQFNLSEDRLHPAFNALSAELASRAKIQGDDKTKAFQLNIVNALWGQKDYKFQAAFLDTLAENYGAGMRLMDFKTAPEDSRKIINTWVSDQTAQKIKDLIPSGVIDPDTRLVLTNAIYFKAAWMDAFEKSATAPGDFTTLAGQTISVPMMSASRHYSYQEGDTYQAVELPYVGDQVGMVILLPKEGQFDAFDKSLNAQKLNDILRGLSSTQVDLSMPKFKVESSFSLAETLKSMGMADAFDPSAADFSGMDGNRDLFIGDVVHKAYVNVDEAGTEAAAATAVEMKLAAALPEQPVAMKIDRPFLFLIWDQGTNSVLFLGRVANPG